MNFIAKRQPGREPESAQPGPGPSNASKCRSSAMNQPDTERGRLSALSLSLPGWPCHGPGEVSSGPGGPSRPVTVTGDPPMTLARSLRLAWLGGLWSHWNSVASLSLTGHPTFPTSITGLPALPPHESSDVSVTVCHWQWPEVEEFFTLCASQKTYARAEISQKCAKFPRFSSLKLLKYVWHKSHTSAHA